MTKTTHTVYINDSLWQEAQKQYGERGISAAIERFFTTELGIRYECRNCGATFSNRVWEKFPERRGKCIECNSFDLKVVR